MAKKRKNKGYLRTYPIEDMSKQNHEHVINLLKRYWIPLLEQTLNQARRLLEKLEKER